MIFENIKIQGFGSYITEQNFTLNRQGITAIVGRAGAGKTTMFAALYWGLFGKPLKPGKSIETWEFHRPKSYKGTKVEITGTKDGVKYTIIRCLNFKGKVAGRAGANRLVILKDGKPVENLRNKDDVKKLVISLVGLGPDLFKNSLLFGQKLERFISQDGPTKKKILEEAFESSFIQDARDFIDKEIAKLKPRLMELSGAIEVAKYKLQTIEANRAHAKKMQEDFEATRESKLKDLKKRKESLKREFSNLHDTYGKLSSVMEVAVRLKSKLAKAEKRKRELMGAEKQEFVMSNRIDLLTHDKEKITREIKGLKMAILKPEKKCSRCKNPLTETQIKEQIKGYKESIKEFQKDLTKVERDLAEAVTRYKEAKLQLKEAQALNIQDLQNAYMEAQLKVKDFENFKTKEKNIRDNLEYTRKQIKDLMQETPKIPKVDNKEAMKTQLNLDLLLKEQKSLNKKLENYNWCLKDPLSNSGIKAHIFDSMLTLINQELSKYTQALGFKISILVDMESAKKDVECIIERNGHFINTSDLSGGQEQLVDLAIAFAMNAIVTKGRELNILLLDEALVYVSGKELEDMFAFIKKIAQNKSVYLITHQPEFGTTVKRTIKASLGKDGNTVFQ